MNESQESLAVRDERLVWHPFTQMKTAGLHTPIVKAEGALLFGENDETYIDAIGSWWVNLHGHSHPHITNSIGEQAKKMAHVMFAGLTHPPAVELCERLQRWLPRNLKRFFFSDNGSTAVEIALKMAIQYRHKADAKVTEGKLSGNDSNAKSSKPYKIVVFEGSYHGDTFGAMAVGERDVFVRHFEPYLFEVITIPAPVPGQETKSERALKKALETERVAAFIFEPLIQAAFGMRTHDAGALDRLVKLCRQNNVFTIADEVMTGFFRTGTCFAVHQLNTAVDFICLGKALTAGTMPLALTVTTEGVYDAFYDDEKAQAFFHGHSYTGNPLGCAAAIASLDLIESGGFKPSIGRVTEYLSEKASDYRKAIREGKSKRGAPRSPFSKVRQMGLMLALELEVEEKQGYLSDLGPKLYREAMKRGVLLRPLGEVIYVVPPICISKDQLDQVFRVIDEIALLK